jgi:phosphohistidine phosphatase
MMTLYFLRHAVALDRSVWKKEDSQRPLNKEGKKKLRKETKGLKHLDLQFDSILTSPYKRAYDTAMIVAEALKAEKKVKVVEDLKSEGSPEILVRQLAKTYRPKDSVLLVGHEPYLSKLISVLIGADKSLSLDFKKGGLCRLDADALRYGRCASLKWWLPPKLLKRL